MTEPILKTVNLATWPGRWRLFVVIGADRALASNKNNTGILLFVVAIKSIYVVFVLNLHMEEESLLKSRERSQQVSEELKYSEIHIG